MISVLMPVYNGQRFLEEAIDSILNQTYRDFELLVIDDGSTDDSPAIVRRYAERDSRVRLVPQVHGGHSAALNNGLQQCRFPWVAIIDADDVAMPTRLERQLARALAEPDVVVWGTDGYHINGKSEVLSSFRVGPTSREECRRMRAQGEIVQAIHPTIMIRRDIALKVGGYDVGHFREVCEDIDLFDRMLAHGELVTIPEPLQMYRIHGSSLSMNRATRMSMLRRFVMARQRHRLKTGREMTMEEFQAEDAARPLPTRVRDWLILKGNLMYRLGGMLYGERRYAKAAAVLTAAVALRPVHSVRRVWTQVFSARARRNIRQKERVLADAGSSSGGAA